MVDTRSHLRTDAPWLSAARRPKVPQWRAARCCAPARAVHPAAARRLPRADQPAVVDAGAARPDRAHRARDRRRGRRSSSSPGWEWPGHEPGQYLRIGIVVDGIHHWRAYSLTSDPGRPDGCISITPKLVEAGKVSPYLVREAQARGDRPPRRRRGHVRAARPAAGPAAVHQRGQRDHADHEHAARARPRATRSPTSSILHSARTADDVIFGAELRELARRHPGFRLHEQLTGEQRPDGARATSTSCARTGASARPSSAARPRCSTR